MSTIGALQARVGSLARTFGYEIRRLREPPVAPVADIPVPTGIQGAHYGCGANMVEGWLNLDYGEPASGVPARCRFLAADLTQRHPFANDSFALAYAEDFLEHLTQAQSLVFLGEACRVLRPGGTLRLSFPGLELVFDEPPGRSPAALREKIWTAYDKWGHVHFYAREELRFVARYVGFSRVEFRSFQDSPIAGLGAMDSRADQRDQNTYAELTK